MDNAETSDLHTKQLVYTGLVVLGLVRLQKFQYMFICLKLNYVIFMIFAVLWTIKMQDFKDRVVFEVEIADGGFWFDMVEQHKTNKTVDKTEVEEPIGKYSHIAFCLTTLLDTNTSTNNEQQVKCQMTYQI